jgi:hypothetical protein
MTQKYFIFLLLTILLIGIFIIYRSYKSVNSISHREKDKSLFLPLQNHSIESINLVNIEFFVMSQCPDAIKCEKLFLPILLKFSSIINFTLSFIALETNLTEFKCKHGHNECIGNKQQLCIQNIYPQSIFIKYLLCQSKNLLDIPDNGEQCAKENLINWSDVQLCVTTNKGNKLFHKSLERTRLALAEKSCTIHINETFWCMHDGFWSNCTEGHDEKSFIKAICSRYNGKNKPNECTNFI